MSIKIKKKDEKYCLRVRENQKRDSGSLDTLTGSLVQKNNGWKKIQTIIIEEKSLRKSCLVFSCVCQLRNIARETYRY